MQEPNEEAAKQEPTEEASIRTENAIEDPNLNVTFALQRKAAKRTLPWDLTAGELDLASPPQATKKTRLEEPFSAATDEAATKMSSHVATVSLPAAADIANHADTDPIQGPRATVRSGRIMGWIASH